MSALALIRQLWQHSAWADEELHRALRAAEGEQVEAWREYLHVLGAEEIWLSRLEQRAARTPVWPSVSPEEAGTLRTTIASGYATFLAQLGDSALNRPVSYTRVGRTSVHQCGQRYRHARRSARSVSPREGESAAAARAAGASSGGLHRIRAGSPGGEPTLSIQCRVGGVLEQLLVGTRSIRNGGTEGNLSSAVLFPNGPVREWQYAATVCDQRMTDQLQLTTAGELPDSELR